MVLLPYVHNELSLNVVDDQFMILHSSVGQLAEYSKYGVTVITAPALFK